MRNIGDMYNINRHFKKMKEMGHCPCFGRKKEINNFKKMMNRLEEMGHCPCFGRKKEINNLKINEEETNLTNSPETSSTAIQTSDLSPVKSTIEAKPSASTVEPSRPSVSAPDVDDPQDKVEKAQVFTYRELADGTEKESYIEQVDNKAQVFTYRELAKVTKNFRKESLIGEGGFGPVYKGKIEKTGQVVAVKQLNQSGLQGNKEFMVEILMLSLMRHPNIVTLIGYCAEGDQRLLVYEFMPLGSLESHLHDVTPDKEPLDWNTRMKIAAGAAQGLDYLHTHNDPPVIYRDMKAANILLGEGYHPKLSDLGMAKFGPTGEMTHVSTRVMGTHGYCAPEYGISGKLTLKSDIYSFGVVLLELITGRRALEMTRHGYRMLIDWARPMFKDRKKFVLLADPRLKGQFLERILQKTVEVVLLCIQDDSQSRPNMSEVVVALNYLASHKYNGDAGGNDSSRGRGQQWNNVDANGAAEPMACPDLILSPREKDPEREKAVAEAKMWGESCRQQRRLSAQSEIDHKDRI